MNKPLITLSLAMSLLFSDYYNSGEPRGKVLKIYNWADYIGDGVSEDFQVYYKEQTDGDIRAVYQTFDINEIIFTKTEKGRENFGVICPPEYTIERVLKKDLLLPIDAIFPHSPDYMNDVLPYIREQIDELSQPGRIASHYVVCYMQGIARILYSKAFAPEVDTEGWDCLWNRRYAGKILMKDSYRGACGTTIVYAHVHELADSKVMVEDLMNDHSPRVVEITEKHLEAMKPNIADWEIDFGKEVMTKSKAWLNMTRSGNAKWAIEKADAVGVELDHAVPHEGDNIWCGRWVIPEYTGNPKAVSYFINFMYRPDITLRDMKVSGYVGVMALPEVVETEVDTTLTYYSDLSYFFGPGANSLQVDKIQYPGREVAGRCAMIHDSGDETREVLEIRSRIKGDSLRVGTTILIFVAVGLMSGWMTYKRIQCYKREKIQGRRSRRRREQR